MICCRTYNDARLAIINLISDTSTQEYREFKITYNLDDRKYPFIVETKVFSYDEYTEMCEMGD